MSIYPDPVNGTVNGPVNGPVNGTVDGTVIPPRPTLATSSISASTPSL